MKVHQLKKILNNLHPDMENSEVLLIESDKHAFMGCRLSDDPEVNITEVVRISDRNGNVFGFNIKEGEFWYVCNRKVTHQDEGRFETKELAVVIGY